MSRLVQVLRLDLFALNFRLNEESKPSFKDFLSRQVEKSGLRQDY